MTKGITFLTAALGCAILSATVQAESNVKYTQTISQATNPLAVNGMVTSPNYLATQAGVEILRKGGSAVDAVIATASVMTVVYPQMCTMGGDNF